ncbi:MAG TPA: lipoprotein signal peptidase [Saprospiraceae bacterium]|nr:lipoprotein signal peptidase [Saprospiraceae bacterium]HRG20640.1 lipoprotein signal peptidase [Saprospiraceae bacterium]
MSKKAIIFTTIILLLIIDQWSKIWIKTQLEYGTGFDILGLSWAKIQFVENEGMAFGLSYGGVNGKYVLSIFRIIMAGFLGYILFSLLKANEKKSLLFSFSLIVAGAIGNIIDCIFYGMIFSESHYHGGLAQFVPFGTGYAPLLQGKVVDMLYFPMVDTILPSWLPIWGGERFEFFRPVFNVADSAITTGVASIILFNRSFFTSDSKKTSPAKPEEAAVDPTGQDQ